MIVGTSKKRQRVGSNTRLSAADSAKPDQNLTESVSKPPVLRRTASIPTFAGGFNDSATADILLRIYIDTSPFDSVPLADSADQIGVQIYLHSNVICRSKYFATQLSDRWQRDCDDSDGSRKVFRLKLAIQETTGSINTHITVLQLLYTDDFSNVICNASSAISILPVALEILFEECVSACVRFLEAVPWTEEEERRVLSLIPFLRDEESLELVARVLPPRVDSSEEMLHRLIRSALYRHTNMTFVVKAFVAKLLRDFSSRDSARRVLDRAFKTSLTVTRESLEEYSSPDLRGDNDETEAIQRLNLHKAMTNARHLSWLVERMIELKVADTAVIEWSDEETSFTSHLQKALSDEPWRSIVPGLPLIVLRCTSKIVTAVASGSILASRQVRMNLVKVWLPVLTACKESCSPLLTSHKSLYFELEETFLKIISTLPMLDAQELLQLCLSFSTRNVDDCPHLITAFNTWFRRASKPPELDKLS